MNRPSSDKAFEKFLRRHRPDTPPAPPNELARVLERTGPAKPGWGWKAGLAVAAIALVLLFQNPARVEKDTDLDAFLSEIAVEMFEPGTSAEEAWDLYVAL